MLQTFSIVELEGFRCSRILSFIWGIIHLLRIKMTALKPLYSSHDLQAVYHDRFQKLSHFPMDSPGYLMSEYYCELEFEDGKCEFDDVFFTNDNTLEMIRGEAGSGKTTLLHQICYNWSCGNEDMFEYIIFVSALDLLVLEKNTEDFQIDCALSLCIEAAKVGSKTAKENMILTCLKEDILSSNKVLLMIDSIELLNNWEYKHLFEDALSLISTHIIICGEMREETATNTLIGLSQCGFVKFCYLMVRFHQEVGPNLSILSEFDTIKNALGDEMRNPFLLYAYFFIRGQHPATVHIGISRSNIIPLLIKAILTVWNLNFSYNKISYSNIFTDSKMQLLWNSYDVEMGITFVEKADLLTDNIRKLMKCGIFRSVSNRVLPCKAPGYFREYSYVPFSRVIHNYIKSLQD